MGDMSRCTAEDMDLAKKIESAKNLAAVKALQAYTDCLREELGDEGIAQVDLNATEHVHTALLFGGAETVALIARWKFTSDPGIIARCMEIANARQAAAS